MLHEQFLMAGDNAPRNRMSRHLYDIEKLMDTTHAIDALNNRQLFEHIVAHRKLLTPVRGISYDLHTPATINILPPGNIALLWERDYTQFTEHMVVGRTLKFADLVERLTQLQENMRKVIW